MTEHPGPRIVVTENGPYHVFGDLPIAIQTIIPNRDGLSWEWKQGPSFPSSADYELCRCGHSKNKPFCDGTHEEIGFDGAETADRALYEDRAERFDGPTLELHDQESLCAFARFCDPGGKIWALIGQTNDSKSRELAIREGMSCPSGRLVVHDKRTRKAQEPKLSKSIGLIEDPALGVSGPLWVRGSVRIESANGTVYEARNRVTLCRCGESSNKPFCDGSHASVKFHDGLVHE